MEAAIGTSAACRVLGKSRATLHRQRNPRPAVPHAGRKEFRHPAELSPEERRSVLAVLDSPRFADKAVAQAYTILLDEGCYLCSQATMHRLLRQCRLACADQVFGLGCLQVGESDRGWPVVADGLVAGLFGGVSEGSPAFDDAGAGAVADGVEVPVSWSSRLSRGLGGRQPAEGGKAGPTARRTMRTALVKLTRPGSIQAAAAASLIRALTAQAVRR